MQGEIDWLKLGVAFGGLLTLCAVCIALGIATGKVLGSIGGAWSAWRAARARKRAGQEALYRAKHDFYRRAYNAMCFVIPKAGPGERWKPSQFHALTVQQVCAWLDEPLPDWAVREQHCDTAMDYWS